MLVRNLGLADPIDAVRRLTGLANVTLLDSAMRHATLGRFSFVAADPFATFHVENGAAYLDGEKVAEGGHDALAALKRLLGAWSQPSVPGLPPFQGGAAGFFSYDFGRDLERLPRPAKRQDGIPAVLLHIYDVVLAWDHREAKAWLISTGWPETDPVARERRAEVRAAFFLDRLAHVPAETGTDRGTAALDWQSNFSRPDYEAAIARTVEYILAGDIFQANIAQRFGAALPAGFDPFAYYRRLREANAATFAAWLDYGELKVASSSPERFFQVYDGRVETRPIKGTIRRSPHPLEDMNLARVLVASEKDRAENVMIVDLLRNDLSLVCKPHTVHVPALCGLETYATVHHLVSVVSGVLEDGLTAVDLIERAFPGGSITGAPKIRAMEIITELEGVERGVYCGSIGYLGFNGAADTNIAIRTVTFTGDEAIVFGGGGITALSDPAAEYDETVVKASRVLQTFRGEGAR